MKQVGSLKGAWSEEYTRQGSGARVGFQVVAVEKDDHLEVKLRASDSRSSHMPPCLLCPLSTGLKHVLLLEAVLRLKPRLPSSPTPRFQEMLSVASLNRLGKVVSVLPSNGSKSWTQNPLLLVWPCSLENFEQ